MSRKVWLVLLILLLVPGVYTLFAAQAEDEAAMVEDQKAFVEEYVEEIFNNNNLDDIENFLAPDYREHNPFAPEYPPGPQTFVQVATGVRSAFPDVHVTIEDIISEPDKVVTRHTVNATHEGDFNGISATEREVTWTEIHIFRFNDDGLIAEHWVELNLAGLVQQLTAPEA